MKIGYVIQKILRKVFNRPCVNRLNIDKSAQIDIGSVVVGTSMNRYSYIGEHTSVLFADIGAFTCISNYCAIGGGSHQIDWVLVSPVFNKTKGIINKKLGSLQYSPFQMVHIGNIIADQMMELERRRNQRICRIFFRSK